MIAAVPIAAVAENQKVRMIRIDRCSAVIQTDSSAEPLGWMRKRCCFRKVIR